MSTVTLERPGLVAPAYVSIPERSGSAGGEVVDLAKLYGRPPDPEQTLAIDIMASERLPGLWAALECAIIECRQNGKTGGVLLPMAMADLFLFDCQMVIWTAHKLDTCLRSFTDVRNLIDGCSDLSRRVKVITEGKGVEAVELMNGARMEFKARSLAGGRGFQGDSITFDEAGFVVDNMMGALVPTMSTVPNAQIRYGGSAGLAKYPFWYTIRDRGRSGTAKGLAYAEWCSERKACEFDRCMHIPGSPGCRLDDEREWLKGNHTLGKRISYEFMRGEREALPVQEFMREVMGWWDDPDGAARVTDEAWRGATDPESVSEGKVMLGIDSSWGLRSTAIVAASWRPDGTPHVETVIYEPGSEWAPARLDLIRRRHRAKIAMARNSPATAYLPDLMKLKMDPHMISDAEMAAECTAIESALEVGGLSHPGDQLIEAAILGAGAKKFGDGGWSWTRKTSTSDICPVVAMTAALRGLRMHIKPRHNIDESFG